jgi:molybdate transport system substrate-binding protein
VRRAFGPALAAALIALPCGCAGSGDSNELVVSAASSLTSAFGHYADDAGFDARQSFGGSDELAAQIRQGVTPDVFAAADTSLPEELHRDGLVGRPRTFATNTLVVAVPRASGIDSIGDLAKAGTTVAIGAPGVPAGDYAREVLGYLGPAEARAIQANVATEEPDVGGIVGKLTQGAVDAGFLYATDVRAAGGELRAVPIPRPLAPDVAYGIAVVKGAAHPGEARRFVRGLFGDRRGARDLRAAGFGRPPR